jgi:hypothetical protein
MEPPHLNRFEKAQYNWHGKSEDEIVQSIQDMALTHGITLTTEQAFEQYVERKDDVVWINDTYQVAIRKADCAMDMIHVSIKRLDREPIHDWREIQKIKNELVGPECEAVEIYPAESRKVDSANQYHLWAYTDPKARFPFGFWDRLVSDAESHNTKQREGSNE